MAGSIATTPSPLAEIIARTNQVTGEAQVKAKYLVENEAAKGELLKAKALGDASLMGQLHMIDKLSPNVETQVIYAGEGTLWTDLKNPAVSVPVQNFKK